MKLDKKNTYTQFFELIVSCSFEAWKIIRKEKKLLISSVPWRSKFVALYVVYNVELLNWMRRLDFSVNSTYTYSDLSKQEEIIEITQGT